MKLNSKLIIIPTSFLMLLTFIAINCYQNKNIHPHTSNQISASKNLDFDDLLSKKIYMINEYDIFLTNKNSFLDNIFLRYQKSDDPKEPNNSIKNSDYGFIFFYKIIDLIIFLDLPDIIKIYIAFFILHLLISFYIIKRIPNKNKKNLFIICYVLNPIIFYVMSYPTYYFLQSIGGFVLLRNFLDFKLSYKLLIIDLVLIYLMIFNRSTGVGFLFGYVYLFIFNKHYLNIKAVFIFIIFFLIFIGLHDYLENKNNNRVWHTIGLGINAYNFQNLDMSDDALQRKVSTKYYETYNEKLNSAGPNNKRYTNIIYRDYKDNFKNNINHIIKNIILNNISIFGYGYISNSKILIILNLIIALICIILSIKRNYKLIFLIFICEISYSFYYPPIMVYRFGSYLLLTFLYIEIISYLFLRYFSKSKRS